MRHRGRSLFLYVLWAVLPLLAWWGIISIYGVKHEVVAAILYAIYLFLLGLLLNLQDSPSFWYPGLVGLLALAGVGWTLFGMDSGVREGMTAAERFALTSKANYLQFFTALLGVVVTGISLLSTVCAMIVRNIGSLFEPTSPKKKTTKGKKTPPKKRPTNKSTSGPKKTKSQKKRK